MEEQRNYPANSYLGTLMDRDHDTNRPDGEEAKAKLLPVYNDDEEVDDRTKRFYGEEVDDRTKRFYGEKVDLTRQ